MKKDMENQMEAQRLASEKKATEERIAKELADKKIADAITAHANAFSALAEVLPNVHFTTA